MRIMTSNIWGDYFNNLPSGRDAKLYGVYRKYAPDVIGFQEVTKGWYGSPLFEWLSEDYYLVGTERYETKNFVPMAIKKELPLIAKGFEYLENTPDASKAITWAVIRRDGDTVAFCNTHFWWMRGTEPEATRAKKGVLDFSTADHCRLRERNAEQLTALMKQLRQKYACPVFAFGDMNATIEEGVFDVYRQNGVRPLLELAAEKDTVCSIHGDPVKDEVGVFHGKRATEDYITSFRRVLCLPEATDEAGFFTSIDHIVALGDGFRVAQYRVIEDQDALDATDHSPVLADIEFLM